MKYDYPYIDCPKHGKQLSYIVCVHIIRHNATITMYAPANENEAGEALCVSCHEHIDNLNPNDLRVICETSFNEFLKGTGSIH